MSIAALYIGVDIRALETMSRPELLDLWAKVIRTPAPKQVSVPYLRRALAFDVQASQHGGLPAGFLVRLNAAARPHARQPSGRPAHGARLLREWNGVTQVVDVVDDGFRWQGQTYRSLSVIARTITGAHWSGPRFFGLSAGKAAP